MKNVINQVYWDRMSETYLYGTAFKKNAKNEVTFKNKLMPSGKTLISWSSIANYQFHSPEYQKNVFQKLHYFPA